MYIKYEQSKPKNRDIDKYIWQSYKLALHQGKKEQEEEEKRKEFLQKTMIFTTQE